MNTREIAVEYRLSHWARIMQERMDSGLSVKAYCEKAGFHENIYYYWQRKLREATCEGLNTIQCGATSLAHPAFAEVKLATQPAFPSAMVTEQSQICVEAQGVRISASSEYPADKLAYLLKAVMQSC